MQPKSEYMSECIMRGLKRTRSEPANFVCASAFAIHNQELVFDNFSSTQDKLIGCVNQINNKGQDMWNVTKEKMEEKGVKGFTTRQLENKYKSFKRKRSCSLDSEETHMKEMQRHLYCLKCGGYARDAEASGCNYINPNSTELIRISNSANPNVTEIMHILNNMHKVKEIDDETYEHACQLCSSCTRFVSVFLSMKGCLRKAFLGKTLKHLTKNLP